jgi:hypothetical protein
MVRGHKIMATIFGKQVQTAKYRQPRNSWTAFIIPYFALWTEVTDRRKWIDSFPYLSHLSVHLTLLNSVILRRRRHIPAKRPNQLIGFFHRGDSVPGDRQWSLPWTALLTPFISCRSKTGRLKADCRTMQLYANFQTGGSLNGDSKGNVRHGKIYSFNSHVPCEDYANKTNRQDAWPGWRCAERCRSG